MAKALEGLRVTLGQPHRLRSVGQQIVLDFGFMAMAEAYRGDYTGAMVHHRILLYAVEQLGGWHRVDPFVREMNRTGDIFLSSLMCTAPLFGLTDDPGPSSGAFRAEVCNSITPERRMGEALLVFGGLWDSVFSDVMLEMLDVVQAAQLLWAFPDADVSVRERDWVLQRSNALTCRLLALVPAMPANSVEEQIQECCRLCFVLWLFYVLTGTAGIPSEPGSLKRVRYIMPEHTRRLVESVKYADALDTYETRWGLYDELLLWVLAFGTLSDRRDVCWFAMELRAECTMKGIYTYDSLAVITSRYLSLDRLEQLSNRKLARTLIAGMVEA